MKKINIDENACIGCGSCAALAGDIFELNDEGIAEIKKDFVLNKDNENDVKDAINNCPTDAISGE